MYAPPRFEPKPSGEGPVQVQGSRRGTITATKGSDELGTFFFLPIARLSKGNPLQSHCYSEETKISCARHSSPFPINDETSLTETGKRSALRSWFLDISKPVISRTQVDVEL